MACSLSQPDPHEGSNEQKRGSSPDNANGWYIRTPNVSAYFYANVCTITGPAIAVAGPVSRGARFCSIHASPRLLDSSAPA